MEPQFGTVIRNRRLELGLSQRWVGESLQVNPDFLSLVEQGRRRFLLERIPRLAAILALDPAELCRSALRSWEPQFYTGLTGEQVQ